MAETVTVGPGDVAKLGEVVAAAGSTAPRGRGQRRNLVEEAMSAAVGEAEAEARAIWEQTDIDVEEKQKRIAAIMNPDAIRERKLAARAQATGRDRELNTEAAKE